MIRVTRKLSSYFISQDSKIEPSNQDIFDEINTIPNNYQQSLSSTLLKFFPIPISSIVHSVRFKKLSFLDGYEIKSGLLEEHSIHILIDCLFLTVTVSPIYNQSLPYNLGCNTSFCNFITALYFFNALFAVMSIVCHALLIFAYVEIPASIFTKWIMNQENAIISANFVHLCNSYLWLATILLYPLATMSIEMGIICTCAGLVPMLFVLVIVGTYATPGTFDSLHHSIKLRLHPNNNQLKLQVENDFMLYKESKNMNNISLPLKQEENLPIHLSSLQDFLKSINLQNLEEILTLHDINNIILLSKMENDDYRALNISIGNKIKIKEALHKLI